MKSLLIFATPRSGSSFFGDALVQAEWLHPHQELFINHWVRGEMSSGKSSSAIVQDRLTNYAAKKGFGVKVMWPDWNRLLRSCPTLLDLFEDPYIVFLHREDKIAQVISLTIAKQTHKWHSYQKAIRAPKFQGIEIAHHLRLIHKWEKSRKSIFAQTICNMCL